MSRPLPPPLRTCRRSPVRRSLVLRKLAPLCLFLAALFVGPAPEAKADTIVLALTQPNTPHALLIPEGQVITSVTYTATYTVTVVNPCTLRGFCLDPSSFARAA